MMLLIFNDISNDLFQISSETDSASHYLPWHPAGAFSLEDCSSSRGQRWLVSRKCALDIVCKLKLENLDGSSSSNNYCSIYLLGYFRDVVGSYDPIMYFMAIILVMVTIMYATVLYFDRQDPPEDAEFDQWVRIWSTQDLKVTTVTDRGRCGRYDVQSGTRQPLGYIRIGQTNECMGVVNSIFKYGIMFSSHC